MAAFLRVLLIAVGLLVLAGVWLFTRTALPEAERVEAAVDVVGVDTGGSYAWIVRTTTGALLIDAGLDPEAKAILAELHAQQLTAEQVQAILLTHGHRDHWAGAAKFPNARVYVAEADAALARGEEESQTLMAPVFRKLAGEVTPPGQVVPLPRDGETVEVDGVEFQVVALPGHSEGSVAFLREGVLFSGDALQGKGRRVSAPPSALSEDAAKNLASLHKLRDLPFTVLADGHGGVTADARSKLRRYLE